MKTSCIVSLAGVAAVLTAVMPSQAAIIRVSEIGGGLNLNTGPLSGTVFGGGPQPTWSDASVATVHAALNAAGIPTNGKVTFVPADTSNGVAFLALVDQQLNPQPPVSPGNLHLDTVARATNTLFVNNASVFAGTE